MDVEGPGNNRPGPGAPGFPGASMTGSLPEYSSSSTNYTIPGILHFIKHEWSRFEKERTNWEVQKAELQAKIAFLQGERKGHENLMHDLIRRIKMLEYALKQERAKLYKALHGKDLVFADMKPPPPETENNRPQLDITTLANQREESRKILRDYLREVGFPDNVLEARVARMTAYKNLYGQNQMIELPGSAQNESPQAALPLFSSSTPSPSTSVSHAIPSLPNGPVANGTDMQAQGSSTSGPLKRASSPPPHPHDATENEIGISEDDEVNAISDEFKFLDKEDDSDEDDDDDDDDEGENGGWNSAPPNYLFEGNVNDNNDDAMFTEDAMDEFQKGSSDPESSKDIRRDEFIQKQIDIYQKNKPRPKPKTDRPSRGLMEEYKKQVEGQAKPSDSAPANSSAPASSSMGMMRLPGRRPKGIHDLDITPEGGVVIPDVLGNLAVISIEPDISAVESSRKWEQNYTLQGHFDVVSSVGFHPTDQIVITGSMDCTLKLWNLLRARQKTRDPRRSVLVDVEAYHTFRGHRGPVLSTAFGLGGDICFSGSTDCMIRVWRLPEDSGEDPFESYDPDIHQGVLQGHTDVVWDLAVHPTTGFVLSCGADGSCRLWNHHQTSPQIREFRTEQRFGNPTSVDFVWTNLHQMVVSYSGAKVMTFDLETGQSVVNLDSGTTYDGTPKTQINKVVCHPTLPVVVSAHEDKYIRFYDVNSGKVMYSTTAHTDAVTGLALDPHGLYLLSGSHDGSLIFWSMDSKMCIQHIGAAHRKHFDEAIYNVTCHSSEPFFASAGADGIAKVFI